RGESLLTSEGTAPMVEIASLDQVRPGTAAVIVIGNGAVVVFNRHGVIHATEAWCMRCGSRFQSVALDDVILDCRGCDWRYDLTTGCVIGLPELRLDRFKVDVVDGRIMVAIPEWCDDSEPALTAATTPIASVAPHHPSPRAPVGPEPRRGPSWHRSKRR